MRQKTSDLGDLISTHQRAMAIWKAVSADIQNTRHLHEMQEKAHETASHFEREMLLNVMTYPVETMAEAREKAAYLLTIDYICDFADEVTMAFVRSFVTHQDDPSAK